MSAEPDIHNSPLCVAVQLWVTEYLNTRESLLRGARRVPVIGRRKTNIQNDIDQAINELGGACIYVTPMLPLKFNMNLPGPHIEQAEVRITCLEDDTLNTELPTVYELVEAVARDLMGVTMGTLPLNVLLPADPRPIEPQIGGDRLIVDVVFHTSGAYQPRIEEQ